MDLYQLIRPIIFQIEPEKAHCSAINFLRFLPRFASILVENKDYDNLHSTAFGLDFSNPIGMAAGFDKNAEIISSLFRFGFGFVEAGTVTPKAQKGNDKPRIFRLEKDRAIINRLGFNGLGADIFEKNLQAHSKRNGQIIGVNIGKNKDSEQIVESCHNSPATREYLFLIEKFYGKSDYITINISSPNTKNLREIQNSQQLDDFLEAISQLKKRRIFETKPLPKQTPILLKIAPDLSFEQQQDIAKIALKHQIDGLIISNTTIARNLDLKSKCAIETGGLSGKPLFVMSNEVLSNFFKLTNGNVPIIGVGGIFSAADAFEKIRCGASLVQIYSAFVFEGFGLVERIKAELSDLLKKNGFKNLTAAIGSKH